MTPLDFFIVIPILLFSFKGIKNGFVGEILGVLGLLVAIYLTFQYMDEVAKVIRPLFNSDGGYIIFVGAAIIFILTLIVVHIVDYLAVKFIHFIHLQILNRIAGFFFGFAKGAIIVSAILIILAGFQYPTKQTRQKSLTYSYVVFVAPWAYNMVSEQNFTDTIEDKIEDTIKDFPILNK